MRNKNVSFRKDQFDQNKADRGFVQYPCTDDPWLLAYQSTFFADVLSA